MCQSNPNNNRVFISFSHRDESTFFSLFTLLRKQSFDPFTYQIYGKEFPPGAIIADRLREEISNAAWFIGLISANSLMSPWVAYEAQCAVRLGPCRLRITPVVDHRLRDQLLHFACDLYPAADQLIRPRALHFGDFDDVESLLKSLFHKYGLPYTSPNWGATDTGLFFQRASEEIPHLTYRDQDHSLGQLGQAEKWIDECQKAYAQNEDPRALERALELAERNDQFLVENTKDGKGSYNLGLIRVSLLMRFARIDPAKRIKEVRQILERLRDHSRRDEVVYQGLGYLALSEEKWPHAQELYEQAHAWNPQEPDAIHGLALATLRAGLTLPPALLKALTNITNENSESIDVLMLAYARMKDWRSMGELLRKIGSGEPNAGFLSAVLVAAFEAGHYANAAFAESWLRGLFRTCRGEKYEERLLAGLGVLAFTRGKRVAARKCFRRLVNIAQDNVNHLGRYMQLLCVSGKRRKAKTLAIRILQLGPVEPQDYDRLYYTGMAKWVLGQRREAEVDFRQSHAEASQHYTRALPGCT
jgi:tetratricopeptide (TPR) repeat protein